MKRSQPSRTKNNVHNFHFVGALLDFNVIFTLSSHLYRLSWSLQPKNKVQRNAAGLSLEVKTIPLLHGLVDYSLIWSTAMMKDVHIHLAQKVSRRFLKSAVCKYPTTVNNSEIFILLPKPCP